MKASDLRQALNYLDPDRALHTEEELRDWFVARPGTPRDDMSLLLEGSEKPQKILFSGHRGSGKTTELAKLSQQLEDQFFVVRYSVKRVLNLSDISHVDVILSMAIALIIQATDHNLRLRLNEGVLTQILEFGKDISRETEIGDTTSAEVAAELNLLFGKLSIKFGIEDATRRIVRERVQYRMSDLQDNVDLLAREVERRSHKKVLAIVEDLDKTDLAIARDLFYEHARSLAEPRISVIYTFPTALRHDNTISQIRMNFHSVNILPNMKVVSRNGEVYEEGVACLRGILNNRLEDGLISPDALDGLARHSGGIPRELVTLARQASMEARKADRTRIELEDVEGAARRVRMDYQVLLSLRQIELLRQVSKSKQVDNDDEHRALLHNLSVLEYRNDEAWHDVHPIVLPLVAADE